MTHVIVVGSLNIDLVVEVPTIPPPGETVLGKNFATFPGGKGANQAVAAARLGAEVSLVGRVGADAFGSQLLANARALEAGEKTWESEIDGATWTQQTFPYQVKCLGWIQERYRALEDAERARVDALLAGTGCEALLAGPGS